MEKVFHIALGKPIKEIERIIKIAKLIQEINEI